MAYSKKQKEHMVQNVVHKVGKKIREMEQKCPKEELESKIWQAYWDKKFSEEK